MAKFINGMWYNRLSNNSPSLNDIIAIKGKNIRKLKLLEIFIFLKF